MRPSLRSRSPTNCSVALPRPAVPRLGCQPTRLPAPRQVPRFRAWWSTTEEGTNRRQRRRGAALPLRGARLSELERSRGRLVRRARCDWCGPFVWPMPLPPGPATACLRRPAVCALVAATQVPVPGLRRPASSQASTRKAARPFLRRCGVGVIFPTSAPRGEEPGAAHIAAHVARRLGYMAVPGLGR